MLFIFSRFFKILFDFYGNMWYNIIELYLLKKLMKGSDLHMSDKKSSKEFRDSQKVNSSGRSKQTRNPRYVIDSRINSFFGRNKDIDTGVIEEYTESIKD